MARHKQNDEPLIREDEVAPPGQAPRRWRRGFTPPATSAAFSASAHAQCMKADEWRRFMEGRRDLPEACKRSHPVPKRRAGLLS